MMGVSAPGSSASLPRGQSNIPVSFRYGLSTAWAAYSLCYAMAVLLRWRYVVRTSLNLTAIGCSLIGALVASFAVAGDAASAAPREPGNWQRHEYSFAYLGFTSTYSCDGLASKLKLLLIASGARADAKSQPGACAAFGRPDKFARADLTFYTLTPGSAEPADVRAEGAWLPVTFTDRSPRDLARGDCELVEQFRANVLPMFTTRNVDSHMTCVPYQESGSVIDLKFDSFAAVPRGHDVRKTAGPKP